MNKKQILVLLIIVVLLIPSIIIVCDFLGFKNAINTYEKILPTSAGTIQPSIFIPHYGYVPFGWRGNFEKVWFRNYLDDEYAKTKDLQDYIQISFSIPKPKRSNYLDDEKFCYGENVMSVNLQQNGDDFWGYWELTEAGKKIIESDSVDECIKLKTKKPFGNYCEIYVHPDYDKKTLLVLILGEDKIFYRVFKVTQGVGSCGGGYITQLWGY